MGAPYTQHLTSSRDLETTYEAVRAGFVALALEKNRRATPFVAEARALKAAASKARRAVDLPTIGEIKPALITAAGVSDKAAKHLQNSDKVEAVKGLIQNFLEPAGDHFVEELVFRFRLTKGDALGGSMRNVGGFLAQKKLTRSVIASLRLAKRDCRWLAIGAETWADLPHDDSDVEMRLRGLSWNSKRGSRTLLYNLRIPHVGNNVDLILLEGVSVDPGCDTIRDPQKYIAIGELKGGIDPAGADEHWKTARSALHRIVRAFSRRRLRPQAFFIGAAIEPAMSKEIWTMLRRQELANAANLTNDDQIASIANWLSGL